MYNFWVTEVKLLPCNSIAFTMQKVSFCDASVGYL